VTLAKRLLELNNCGGETLKLVHRMLRHRAVWFKDDQSSTVEPYSAACTGTGFADVSKIRHPRL
jgi:hypothetical protein